MFSLKYYSCGYVLAMLFSAHQLRNRLIVICDDLKTCASGLDPPIPAETPYMDQRITANRKILPVFVAFYSKTNSINCSSEASNVNKEVSASFHQLGRTIVHLILNRLPG